MIQKKNILILFIFIMLLLLGIGFAYLSTTLNINGSSSIHDASWDIHFENVVVSVGSVIAEEPEIDSLETTVTYDITLTNPGDFFEFTVDAVNDGSIDAMIDTVLSTLNNTEVTTLPSYLEYTVTYLDGGPIISKQELNAGEQETYKVRVGYKKDITTSDLPVVEQDLSLSFTVNYVQKDNTSVVVSHPESFGTDSWETIIGAVKSGHTSKYHVGDTKDVDMGSYGVQPIRIVNMSTPEECSSNNFSQTGCGFVLEFSIAFVRLTMNYPNTNVGNWPSMDLRTYGNSTLYNAIPSPLREAIIETNVVSGENKFPTISTTVYESVDKVFILSYCEMKKSCITNFSEYGHVRLLDYYQSGNLCKGGSNYWVRTTYQDDVSFYVVDSDTCAFDYTRASQSNQYNNVAFAFRIG